MITPALAAFLGLVQGITEFLPVSSSGHLVIFQEALGFSSPPVAFDVMVHVATLFAVVVFFWEAIVAADKRLIANIFAGTLPTALIAFVLKDHTDFLFGSSKLVAIGMMTTTVFLASSRLPKARLASKKQIGLKTAFLIGAAQGLAIIPGISRSGITITSGLWLGLKPKQAIQFAFILSIPAILGAQALEFNHLINSNQLSIPAAAAGFFSSLASGWLALRLLSKLVYKAKIHRFAIYTFLVSLALFLF